MGNRASDDQKQLPSAFQRTVFCVIYPATARYLREPPGADPHAGWCGGWGLKTPGYPIEWNFIDISAHLFFQRSFKGIFLTFSLEISKINSPVST